MRSFEELMAESDRLATEALAPSCTGERADRLLLASKVYADMARAAAVTANAVQLERVAVAVENLRRQ